MIVQEIRNSIAKKPYIFVIFQGESGPPDPLWIRVCNIKEINVSSDHSVGI